MVGSTQDVLVVEEGTGDSVKCRDGAYRQIIVQHADEYGLSPGDFTTVEVTDSQTMYTFGTPVDGADTDRAAAPDADANADSAAIADDADTAADDADSAAATDDADTAGDDADALQPEQ
jgi:hypothetical protein